MTQVHNQVNHEENNYLPIEDFLLWAEQHGYEIPIEVQERLLSFQWLKDTRALKCLFGSQLVKFLGLTDVDLEILNEVYLQFSPVILRSLTELNTENSLFFSTGSKNVDELLKGGIETGHLFEFTGPPASGKTQFCYATLLSCYNKKNNDQQGNSIIWLDTEHSLLPSKVKDTIKKLQQNDKHLFKFVRIRTFPEFLQAMLELLKFCQSEYNLRLIIIDSLIAPFDRHYQQDFPARAQALRELIGFLKDVCRVFNCAIIITNQVRKPHTDAEKETGEKHLPLGGFAFAHATENRFLIEPLEGRRKKLKVLDSSYLPNGETIFYLNKEGIADVANNNFLDKQETCLDSSKEKRIFD
ncbi:MAG: AAA family ATPase [Candidatus Heimdallarchaeota archaeon]